MTNPADLKIDDRVVMRSIPKSVTQSDPRVRDGIDGILRVYQRAVAKQSRLRVNFMDELGRPWVEYSFRNKRCVWEHHFMLVDDDSYERIPRPDA
jgi:hypothetical protein